ncbi:MAG: hypothetical protein KAT58_12695 [candidate division Zixibacteria bacterium]|nr:hypothetical protein [candidate division Zixibacteria bacterium]
MRLDLAIRTLFAEFQESVFARAALARELKQSNTYVRKKVKGKVYWYLQRYEDGQYKQQYFGPSNIKNDSLVEKARRESRKNKSFLKQLGDRETRQAAMLRKGGLPGMDKRVATVLLNLSDARLINEGGVLVGTLALNAYAGILGALFEKTTLKTNDIDVAYDSSLEIALGGSIDVQAILNKSSATFRGVPGFKMGELPAAFISSDGIRVDFVVPQRGRPRGVVPIRGLAGIAGVSLPFLDFLIESPIRTVLIAPNGGIPVQVPDPSRYAVHKLIVASRRSVVESAKRKKDLVQASQLIEVLADEYPSELIARYKEASKRGTKWMRLLKKAVSELPSNIQELLLS